MAVTQIHVVYDQDSDLGQGVFSGTPTFSISGSTLTLGTFNVAYGQGWRLYSDISQDPGYLNTDTARLSEHDLEGTSIDVPVVEGMRVLYFFNLYTEQVIAKVYIVMYPDNTELCSWALQEPGSSYMGREGVISGGWDGTNLKVYIGLQSSAVDEFADISSYNGKIGAAIEEQDSAASLITFTNRVVTLTSLQNSSGVTTTLASGQSVYIGAINYFGSPVWQYTATLPTPAATQLSSPVVTTTATADTITPSWSNVSNAFAYRVRYSTSNPPTGDGTTTTSGTAITGLTASTTYYVQVKAVGNGQTYTDSDWSTVVSQTTTAASSGYEVAIVILSEMSDYLDAVTGTFNPATGLTLTNWTYSSGTYTSYSFGPEGNLVNIDPVVAGQPKVLSSITTTGVYQLQVVDDTSYPIATATVTITGSGPTALIAPGVSATATSNTITPTWNAVTNASSYKIRYSTSNPPTGDGTTTTSGTAITGLTASTTYYVQVKAVGDGTSYSDSEWSTVVNVWTSPAIITDFEATATNMGVQCTFTAPIGVSNTATIAWQRSTDNSTWTTVATTNLDGTSAE